MAKFLNADRVLCLSPHPDDIEYGALASMYKFQDTQFDIITISIGGKFDTSSSRNRHQECMNIWSSLPNVKGSFLSEDHTINIPYDFLVNKIETTHDISSYDLILLPPEEDTHHDHKKINNVGMAACRRHAISVVDYRTPSTLDTWIPNVFVDVTEHLEEKIKQFDNFESQRKHLYFTDEVVQDFHTNYQCARRGIKYVEMFKIHRLYH